MVLRFDTISISDRDPIAASSGVMHHSRVKGNRLRHRMENDAMRSFDPGPFPQSYNVDAQLVAAVQINAGARCHESASLLSSYHCCAELYRRAVDRRNEHKIATASKLLEDAERNLRKFLFRCRQIAKPWEGSCRDRCVTCA
jgi:hypothetical protein